MTQPLPVHMYLPDKPSDLIDLALDDLEKCEKSPAYRVDMYSWHQPVPRSGNEVDTLQAHDLGESSICLVCLAGAAIAQTLKADPGRAYSIEDFDRTHRRKLAALDYFRTGQISAAFMFLRHNARVPLENRLIKTYEDSPWHFKSDMRQLAADLREAGY